MQPVHAPVPVLCQLFPEHGESPQFRVYFFRQIRHAIVSILHKVCNQLRILPVIFLLAVILQLLRLFYRIRVHLHDTDPI